MIAHEYPEAWSYHRNTWLWPFSSRDPRPTRVTADPWKEYPNALVVGLPTPTIPAIPLREVLPMRSSCRRFTPIPVGLGEISSLLHGTYGISRISSEGAHRRHHRMVPSAGGISSLELYAVCMNVEGVEEGMYHYHGFQHVLERIDRVPDLRSRVARVFLDQPALEEAAALIVFCAVPARLYPKYQDRGYRYLLLEAGHAAQNLNLIATALGLGSLNLGGFFDAEVAALLQLDPEDECPIYAAAVGATEASGGQGRTRAEMKTAAGE